MIGSVIVSKGDGKYLVLMMPNSFELKAGWIAAWELDFAVVWARFCIFWGILQLGG